MLRGSLGKTLAIHYVANFRSYGTEFGSTSIEYSLSFFRCSNIILSRVSLFCFESRAWSHASSNVILTRSKLRKYK